MRTVPRPSLRRVAWCAAWLAASLLGGVRPASVAAQAAVVVGRVVDASERPLTDAAVSFDDTEITALTDAAGRFVLRIDFVDSGTVAFRKVGFAPARISVRLARGDTAWIVARLVRTTVLDTVRALAAGRPSARLAGFEARRLAGRGVFITRDDLERRNHVSAVDALRWSGALRIVDSGSGMVAVSLRGTKYDRARRTFDAPCIMRIAIDREIMPAGYTLSDLPSPQEIEGIEIFKGPASMPADFAGARNDAYCGLIAVWTRSR